MSEPTAETNLQVGTVDANKSQALNSTSQADKEQSQTENQSNNADLAALVKERDELRKEAASYRKKAKDQEVASQQAEESRLKEQGEFKALAEKHEARVKELEPQVETLTSRYARLTELTRTRIEAETKDWPKEVKDLLPTGDKVDALELTEAIEKYRPLAEKFKAGATGTSGAAKRNPTPTGANNPFDPDTLKARMRQQLGL